MKLNYLRKLATVFFLALPFIGSTQLSVTNGYTAQQLGNNLAGNNINVFNATITGGAQQYGQFQYSGNDLGLNSGVILSTGNIFQAVGPNNESGTTTSIGGPGNTDLTNLAGFQTFDAVVFNFDFEVQGDEIEFNFVFMSEEYNEFVNSGFNDVFAFYISGPGIVGQENLAVVPGTTTPVTINSINNGSFWQFFNDNTDNGTNIEFDGFTTLMTASKSGLIPCGVYTLSLRLADGSDSALDSGVLLQENSLVQTNVSASSNTFSGNNTALEGCIEASFTFAIDSALAYDVTIPISIGGSATNGVDYAFIDNEITIPAGQLSSTLIIDAVADGLTEGQEVVELYFSPSPCAPIDTVYLYIDDYTPLEYNVTPTDVTCAGAGNGAVDLDVSGGIAPYTLTLTDSLTGNVTTHTNFPVTNLSPGTYYVEVIDGYGCSADDIIAGNIFDAGTTFIPDGQGQSYSSSITLGGFGAAQTIQSADQIQSICATLEHSRIGELEITLTAPNGQIVVLKEQPGGATCNMGEPCAVGPTDGGQGNSNTDPGIGYNYCWQATSTYLTMVDESNSFTYTYTNPCDGSQQSDKYLPAGSYQPYEGFENFIGAPLNGAWTITVTDEIPNNNGYIFDWSIVLQADPPDSVFTISQPIGPAFSHTVVQPSCGGTNGSINLTVTGGTGPFTYLWSNGATTQDINGIAAGAYTVNITDGTSCTYPYQVNLSSNGALTVTGVVTNQTCFGLNNGSIDVTVSGGTAPVTYLWNNGATTEDLSLLAPGTYTISVQDGASCQGVVSFTVGAASQINISSSVTNEFCGDEEGIIDISVIGAIAPVSYSWNNGAVTEDISELQQGTYTVNLTDANNCVATATYNVINLVGNCVPDCDLAISNSNVVQESCGNGNGSINLTVFTTNGPTQFSWNNGATTEDLTNISAGTYSVSISDNEGCVVSETFTITNQAGTLAITGMNVTNENCGNNQGAIDATVSGGILPYSYSWSNGAVSQDISGIEAGTFTLTVTDATGCSVNQATSVQNISGNFTQTYGNAVNEVCNNNAGSIDIQIAGGTAPITYLWSNGATSQDLLNLSEGTYSCTITDANGCSINTPVYAVQNLSGTLAISNIDIDNEVCSNAQGDIAISVTGGSAPYSYLWNTGILTQNINSLTAGTYNVTVSDNTGCSINSGNLVVINESGTLNLTSVSTFNELCGNNTGSVNISVTGGTAPLTFLWNTGSTSSDLTNLSAGNYTCTITDASNCSVQASTTVFNDPGNISIDNMVVTNETCGQGNGAINLIVSGAASPITYSWSNGATSEDLSLLSANTYTVQVVDNNGCTASQNAVVNNNANGLVVTDAVLVSEICGAGNGSINVSTSGGALPLTYSWSNGSTNEDLNSLSAGIYSCTIADNNGCSVVAGPYSISNSSGTLNASLVSVTEAVCSNNNGEINVVVTGGAAPYTYSWSNGATTEDLSSLTAGTYVLTVSDQNGCVDQLSVTVNNSSGTLAIASILITDETCNNNLGAINLSVQGGTLGYNYSWSNGAVTEDLTSLSEGTFTVLITDANGCQVNSGQIVVNNNSGNFDVTGINVTDEICGDGTGYIDLIVSGATGSVSYSWSNGAFTQDLANLSSGSYSGFATDLAGCSISFSATVNNEPGNLVATSAVTPSSCYNSNGSIDLTLNGGTSPYTFLWSNGSTTEDISLLTSGNYIVNISDANGCNLNYSVSVIENGGPQISGATITDEVCGNGDGSISLNVTGGTAPFTYDWNVGTSDPCCTYTLDMQDLGNSWNGASITVTVDGNSVGNFTVPGGGANVGTFSVCDGSAIQMTWNAGGFDNEVSFDLLDGSGNVVYAHNPGTAPVAGVIYTGTATCAPPVLTGNTITGLSAGTYSVVVTDVNGCEDSTTIVVNNSSGTLQITNETLIDETCSLSNGSIDLTISGDAPFTYLWSNGATTQDLSNLTSGNYAVTVTQQNGCSTDASYTLQNFTNGLELTSSTIVDETCGDGTGSITITTIGGIGALNYAWSNGFTAQNISGLSGGEYTVIISDGSACDLTETFTVGNNTGTLAVNAALTNDLCGTNNGSINLSVSGGTAPYSILWSNFEITEDISGLTAGTYNVTVTDDAGCEISKSYSIQSTNPLVLTATTTNDNCLNGNGAVNLTVIGGTQPYTYSWSNGATTQDLAALNYGPYTVTVTETSGCTATATYNVASTGNIQAATAAITNEICGNANGSINLSFSGPGAAPDVYNWSNGETTQDITGLSSGYYWVEYQTFGGPGGGCTEVDTFFVGSMQGTLSIDSIVVLNESCSQTNGSLNAYVSGGQAPYIYSWSNGATSEDVSGISAGSYTITVTDVNGCIATASETVSNFTFGFGLSSAIVTNENCGDGTGAIDITVVGGSPGYTYSWSNGATSEDLNNLNAGIFTVTITDANGCIVENSIEVENNTNGFIVTSIVTNETCGSLNGAIDLTVYNGSGVTFNWNNSATTEDLGGLTGGTYDCIVTDGTGCIILISETVESLSPNFEMGTATVVDENCGNAEGSILLNPTGGASPLTYDWNLPDPCCEYTLNMYDLNNNGWGGNPAPGVRVLINGAEYGVFMVPAVAGNSFATEQIPVCSGDQISFEYIEAAQNGNNTYEVLDSDGNILFADGPNPFAGVAFTTNANCSSPSTNSLSGLSAGDYQVTVTDANGCQLTEVFTVANITGDFAVNGTVTNTSCELSNGAIDLSSTGGTAPYTYSWTTSETTEDMNDLPSGTYEVAIEDAAGCIINQTYEVQNIGNGVDYIDATIVHASCGTCADGSATLNMGGATAPYVYNWNGANPNALLPGDYSVTITNIDGCDTTITVTILDAASIIELTEDAFMIVPNPSNGQISIIHQGIQLGATDLKVFDAAGRVVYQSKITIHQGTDQHDLDLTKLAPGSYMITLEALNNKINKRVVIH